MMMHYIKKSFHIIYLIISLKLREYTLGLCLQDELGERLRAERPRNRLDTRHRLDKDGKRYGKVIDFKVSELRAIELLEGICDGLKKYQLDELEGSWVLSNVSSTSGSKEDEQMLKDQRRILRNMCADIIGPLEDELATSIRQGKAEPKSIRSYLCAELTPKCPDLKKERENRSEL
jgi:hypothetical protein